jgi:acylphosphatase
MGWRPSRPGEGMHQESRRVTYSGRVQGVGFRFTSERLAREFDVAGHVRNLPDGRVELVAEGDPAEIDAFLQTIHNALGRYIRDVAVESCPVSVPSLAGFTIQY